MRSEDKWDYRFIQLAKLVGSWSKDPSTKVGACIVDSRKRVISVGFNGPPVGVEEATNRQQKLMRTIHAEANALHFATRDWLEGCTIYVTHPPCAHCASHITQRGIKDVVCLLPSEEFLSRWGEDYTEATQIFAQARVSLTEVYY